VDPSKIALSGDRRKAFDVPRAIPNEAAVS